MDFNKDTLKKLEEDGKLKDLPEGQSVQDFVENLPDTESGDTFNQNEIDDILNMING